MPNHRPRRPIEFKNDGQRVEVPHGFDNYLYVGEDVGRCVRKRFWLQAYISIDSPEGWLSLNTVPLKFINDYHYEREHMLVIKNVFI